MKSMKSEGQEKGGKDIIYVHIIYIYIQRERERGRERDRKRCNVKKRKRGGERNDKFNEIRRIKAMPMLTMC